MPLATRRKLSSRETSSPSTSMLPLFTGITPIRLLNSVVLPMPLRPMIATVSFFAPSNEMPCSASLWP